MLEFLASEMGFSIFSIEANMPEAYRLNDYVLNGAGDPAQLLKGMYFWTWDTEEVLSMIQWMRAFNQSGKGRVQFTGFDMQIPTVAAENVRAFVARYEAAYVSSIADATTTALRVSAPSGGPAFGVATASFPIARAAGKKVRYSGYIKTEGVTRGFAGLWWRVDGPSGVLAFDNMQTRGVTGSKDWMHYTIELPVDASVTNINFGALMPGDGTAWFDDLTIELDGQPYTETHAFDLGFESSSPRGFYTGGNGYRVQLDSSVVHGGKQSLRMQFTGPATANAVPPPPNNVPAATAAKAWKDVVGHLESARAAYRTAGATDADIEWTVQNARVVLQGMQMRANEVSRDRSMAENVKWILDRNPMAKVVLWAHNGHVATGGISSETMGAALRAMYGSEMVVFGLAFNQGSFQAIAQGGGGLKNFTVPPARPDTLDATLASAGIPLFVVDLRMAPSWFAQPRGSRQIGAMYPEGDPYALVANITPTAAFDAVAFFETTTVARKNPGQ
jgi:erythromycin esterase-like protein